MRGRYRMNRSQFFFDKRVSLLTFLPLFIMLIGFLTGFLETPEYQACATVMLIREREKDDGSTDSLQAVKETAETCAAIARTDQVAWNIRQLCGDQYTLNEIKEKVYVRLLPGTVLLQVTARDGDGNAAANLANSAATAVMEEVRDVLSISGARIVSPALPPERPVPGTLINTAVGGMAGLVLTFTIILFIDFFKKVN